MKTLSPNKKNLRPVKAMHADERFLLRLSKNLLEKHAEAP